MNEIPDIEQDYDIVYSDEYNPTIKSPNCEFSLQFYQTKESLMDIDLYRSFLTNAISRFRHSRSYKYYKSYLEGLGLDKCQVLGNIDSNMAKIEMHHNFLTIYDIALMICEHTINTIGYISTFDLAQKLKEEHKNNRIPIVMLSKTAHQMYHNNDDFMLPSQMCFGYWQNLLIKYNKGITLNIANKVIKFIEISIETEKNNIDFTNNLLKLRSDIEEWSYYNEYGDTMRINGIVY